MKDIAIIGAGGNSKVIIDLLDELNRGDEYKSYNIVGIYDDFKTGQFSGYNILGKISSLDTTIDTFVIGIGNDELRVKIYKEYTTVNWATLIHPKSIVSHTARVGKGTVIYAGAIVQPEVSIGKHCILNTNCSVDHESIIGDLCQISPGATICGQVHIGDVTYIGANATIIQCLKVGKRCIIGAGSVIIKDISDNTKMVGNPGRIISS